MTFHFLVSGCDPLKSSLSDYLLRTVLVLHRGGPENNPRHLLQYFHLFVMYAGIGMNEVWYYLYAIHFCHLFSMMTSTIGIPIFYYLPCKRNLWKAPSETDLLKFISFAGVLGEVPNKRTNKYFLRETLSVQSRAIVTFIFLFGFGFSLLCWGFQNGWYVLRIREGLKNVWCVLRIRDTF